MSVFDTWLDYAAKTPHVVLADDLEKADTALAEERAARLKAEAERDRIGEAHSACMGSLHEALALLSKAREAWARWRAFRATFTRDGKPPELKGPAADLAKILGTGETT